MTDVNQPSFWEESYRDGRAAWDLGEATPVFRRLAESGQLPPGRMLVLCAGRGHDARLFASLGFEVVAVDFAETAVQAMQALADPQAPVEILQTDLFALPESLVGTFDYVLEYTCYCAIDPQRRLDYVTRVSRLLKPGGLYIALAFPIGTRPGGPPYTYQPQDLVGPFIDQGFDLRLRESPPDSAPGRQGVEELIILRKPCTTASS
jgi:SAM-dependent methyltransferase